MDMRPRRSSAIESPVPPQSQRWRDRRVSPRTFQIIAGAAVWALALTIISGAAVRLTGSGLGCPAWPRCTATSPVAPLQAHAWIEFGNRLINAFVTIAALGALGAALLRSPRRKDLTWLSVGLLVGLLVEVVLGGLTVEHKLAPGFVMAHFLVAMVFLGDAVVLHYRSGLPDPDESGRRPAPVPLVSQPLRWLARLVLATTAVVITLGTIVTSTGPHGGDPTVRRFGFSLHRVAQLHSASVETLLALTIVLLWGLARSHPPASVMRKAEVVLVAMAAQAAIGYIQYFNGDPVGVVALHVAGACILVIAMLRFYLGLTAHPAPAGVTPAAEPVESPVVAGAAVPSAPDDLAAPDGLAPASS
jgi:cytochrome c oxidase assembly protein subunit 15